LCGESSEEHLKSTIKGVVIIGLKSPVLFLLEEVLNMGKQLGKQIGLEKFLTLDLCIFRRFVLQCIRL
jgi:hypothetical protein